MHLKFDSSGFGKIPTLIDGHPVKQKFMGAATEANGFIHSLEAGGKSWLWFSGNDGSWKVWNSWSLGAAVMSSDGYENFDAELDNDDLEQLMRDCYEASTA